MATKEDILEQLVEEYLTHKGYFVRHNIKYLPSKEHPDFITNQDSNHSDIDVLAIHPLLQGPERVLAVSCKSWQSGFNISTELNAIKENKTIRGREAWRGFRELVVPKWSEAFIHAIEETTGSNLFTYVLAVAKVNGNCDDWVQYIPFKESMRGNPIKILSFAEMISEISQGINTTLASTEVGRMLQVIKASGVKI
jgi:hypothetical protein